MRHIVHVWQSAGDEDIALPGIGENLSKSMRFFGHYTEFSWRGGKKMEEYDEGEEQMQLLIQHFKGINQVVTYRS